MVRRYLIHNSLVEGVYVSNSGVDSNLRKAKLFSERRLAEKYISDHNLHGYEVRMKMYKSLNESIDDEDRIIEDIKSSVNDCKDIIDVTLELIDMYKGNKLDEEFLEGSNIEDIYKRLKKVQKYMSGMIFYPSFYNSKNEIDTPKEPTIDPDGGSSQDAESTGDGNAE